MSAEAQVPSARIVPAVHGKRHTQPDPPFEIGLSDSLRSSYSVPGLIELYARFAMGEGPLDTMMRRCIWRAAARRCGHGLQIGSGVGFRYLETFELGDSVLIGAQAHIQGRHDGTTVIGNHVWIGPQAYLDARDLVIEDYVEWGPGARVLGSSHTGMPADVPIVHTDLAIKPVRVCAWANIGINATILPGVKIGRAAIVGAGAVVIHDVDAFAIVAGLPARFLRWRDGTTEASRALAAHHCESMQ
jgi:acetyltransferase-like isoleucine patch superfamily enzyme